MVTLAFLLALISAACQGGGGIGMGFESSGPSWGAGSFSGGKMYGAPMW